MKPELLFDEDIASFNMQIIEMLDEYLHDEHIPDTRDSNFEELSAKRWAAKELMELISQQPCSMATDEMYSFWLKCVSHGSKVLKHAADFTENLLTNIEKEF